MTTFDTFVPHQRTLSAQAIAARGWAARPYPEMLAEEEIRAIAALFDIGAVTLWAWAFGRPARRIAMPDIELDMSARWDNSALNLLLEFDGLPLMIWEEEQHAYFVIFGAPQVLARIEASGIFDYSFEDYLAEPCFEGPKAAHLLAVQEAYSIPPAKA